MNEQTVEQVKVKGQKLRYYVDRKSFCVQAAVILMALSAVFRLVGSIGLWGDSAYVVMQIILPICCNVLFIVCLILLGGHLFWSTSLPVLLGIVFFIVKALSFESWLHMVLCVALYLLVAVLYIVTVFGVIKTKWLLVPLFALPFLYHVCIEDVRALRDAANPVTFSAGMLEISVLCIMLALLFTVFAMKKKQPKTEPELPKIKGPRNVKVGAAESAVSAEEPERQTQEPVVVAASSEDEKES